MLDHDTEHQTPLAGELNRAQDIQEADALLAPIVELNPLREGMRFDVLDTGTSHNQTIIQINEWMILINGPHVGTPKSGYWESTDITITNRSDTSQAAEQNSLPSLRIARELNAESARIYLLTHNDPTVTNRHTLTYSDIAYNPSMQTLLGIIRDAVLIARLETPLRRQSLHKLCPDDLANLSRAELHRFLKTELEIAQIIAQGPQNL